MLRLLRVAVGACALTLPTLALARPPLVYHHVTSVPAPAGGSLQLRLGSQDAVVTVRPVHSVSVTVDIWARAGSDRAKAELVRRLAPTATIAKGQVLVSAPTTRGWHMDFGWGASPEVRVSIVMPADMKLDYRMGSGDLNYDNPAAANDIDGENGSGDTRIAGSSGRLNVDNGSGDVFVTLHGAADSATITAGSGDVHFSGSARSLVLRSGSGDVEAEASARSAMLRTGSGDISARWHDLAPGAVIQASSGSGDLLLRFPAETVLAGRLSTGSGDIESAFAATRSGSRHVLTLPGGANAVTLDASTGSGDLILRKGG